MQVSFTMADVSAPNMYFNLRCNSAWAPAVFLVVLDVEEGLASAEVSQLPSLQGWSCLPLVLVDGTEKVALRHSPSLWLQQLGPYLLDIQMRAPGSSVVVALAMFDRLQARQDRGKADATAETIREYIHSTLSGPSYAPVHEAVAVSSETGFGIQVRP